jgi:hypothetical protein
MPDPQEPEEFKDIWDKLEDQELELHAIEELATLLDQAKAQEGVNGELTLREQRTSQIDGLFQHIMGRIQEESKKDFSDLVKRLVALNRLETGFVSLLVARIEVMEQRIHVLQREQSRLERIIDASSQSILRRLFTGVKSQFQLKNVKAELRRLTEEKQRIWQKKEAFNQVRESLLGKTKEKAKTVLQERRERGLILLQDYLFGIVDEALKAAEASGNVGGFQLSEADHVAGEHRFGRFVRGLGPKEKNFIDKAGDVNSYAEGEGTLLEDLKLMIHEIHPDAASWLPNRCLFLSKLLAKQADGSLIPTDQCVALYHLFERVSPTIEALKATIAQWPEEAQRRLAMLVGFIRRIAALNRMDSHHLTEQAIRKNLTRIFRDLLIDYSDVMAGLSEQEKPTPFERRRHQERVNRVLDDALRFMVDH